MAHYSRDCNHHRGRRSHRIATDQYSNCTHFSNRDNRPPGNIERCEMTFESMFMEILSLVIFTAEAVFIILSHGYEPLMNLDDPCRRLVLYSKYFLWWYFDSSGCYACFGSSKLFQGFNQLLKRSWKAFPLSGRCLIFRSESIFCIIFTICCCPNHCIQQHIGLYVFALLQGQRSFSFRHDQSCYGITCAFLS
jgi:hypothetical protein